MLKPLVHGLWRLCVPHQLGQRLAVATALASTLMLVLFGLYSLSVQTRLATRMLERGHTAMALYIAQEIARAVQVREAAGVRQRLDTIVMSAGAGVRRVQVAGVAEHFYDRPPVLIGVRPGVSAALSCGSAAGRYRASAWLIEVGGAYVMCVSRPLDATLPGAWLLIEFEAGELADIRRSLMFDTLTFASLGALAASLAGLWIGRRTARGVSLAGELAERIESDPVMPNLSSYGLSLEVRRLIQALMRASHRLRQQREALLDSQTRNTTVVNAALDAIVTLDENGRIVEFNPAAERTFSQSREAVLGHPIKEMLLPTDQHQVHGAGGLDFLFGGDRRSLGKRVELTVVRRDGQEFPAEMAIVEHGGGGRRLYTAYVRDISERVEAAGALRRSERRHREVLESLGEVVFSLDMGLRLVYVNTAWTRLTGSEVAQALGATLTEFIDARDVTLFNQTMGRAAADREAQAAAPRDRVEVRLRHRDGEVRWCLLECRVLTDADGCTSGYGGSMIDVSAQRAAQMRLEDQLKFAETLVESVPHALFVRDTDSRFRAVNRAFEELAGMDRTQLLGQMPDFLLGESEAFDRVLAEDREMLIDGQPREREMSLLGRGAGPVRWFRQYKTVYRNADGQPGGILGFITDITDQRESVDMLRKAASAAEAANEAKSTFLANMSHEIRTPMNAIIGMTQLALEGPLTEDQRELIGIVQSSGQSLLSLINDILDHSKIEAGRFDLEHQPFDLHECIGLAVTMMREKAREKHLRLETTLAEDVPAMVVGDGHRLRQIMLNLLSNAVKFTTAGGVQVVVTRRAGASADAVVLHVRVRDTGIGIAADKLDIIFEPFTQADSSTTRRFGGTGLGLSVCRRIVGLMGGEMWVESQPDEGSTFHFTLMLARADEAQVRARWPVQRLLRESAGTAGTTGMVDSARPVRVLVVEHPQVGGPGPGDEVLHALLSSWTTQVQVLPSMAAALAMLDGEGLPEGALPSASMPVVLVKSSSLAADDHQALVQHRLRRGPVAVVIVLADVPVPDALQRQVSRCVPWPTDASTLFDAMTGAPRFVESALGRGDAEAPAEPQTLRRHRILLVEDNPINQKLALRLLCSLGHDVVVANDGAEAVERVSLEDFDLVFMDVQMPVMGGFEATDMIRRLDLLLNRHTPIVAMTAHAMSGDRERCLNAGMDGYLSKPISLHDLQAVIRDHAIWQPTAAGALTVTATLTSALPPAAPPATTGERRSGTTRVVFDRARALAHLGGDEELFDELARIYLNTLATDLAKLARTTRGGRLDELAHVAHTFKGTAAALGGGLAQALAGDLEQCCRARRTDGLVQRVAQLDAALRTLGDVLSVSLAAPGQSG